MGHGPFNTRNHVGFHPKMTAEIAATIDAAWDRLREHDHDTDAYQLTGTCLDCGARCWDNFFTCGDCDRKAPPAAIFSFNEDGSGTVTEVATGRVAAFAAERT